MFRFYIEGFCQMGNIKVLERIESIRNKNTINPKAINKDLYRLICNPEILQLAYGKIKSNPGNMTPGTDEETLDGYSIESIKRTIKILKDQTFKFKPVRRVEIPKGKTGKMRPLGVPSPRDKVIQQSMLMIMEAIYEPTFSELSNGFRPGRSCHTALKEFRTNWSGTKWAIEGDIKGCYDHIDHHILIKILRKKIQDEKFIQLVWKLLRAGMQINKVYSPTKLGTPQGGILSPLLANIYLNELDLFMESLFYDYNMGTTRRKNPEYENLRGKIYRFRTLRTPGGISRRKYSIPHDQIKKYNSELKKIPSDPLDPKFRRIRYIRYSDDWIVGIIGPKALAQEVQDKIQEFLKTNLKLALAQEKTKISNLPKGKGSFLGFYLKSGGTSEHSSRKTEHRTWTVGGQPRIFVPMDKIVQNLKNKNFCNSSGVGCRKKGWLNYPDKIIIIKYNYVIRGLRNYYSPADNLGTSMNRIQYILKYSCAHTLASKHRTRISSQIKRLKSLGLDIKYSKVNPWDFKITCVTPNKLFDSYVNRTNILLATHCQICEEQHNLEVHHLKALRKDGADLQDK